MKFKIALLICSTFWFLSGCGVKGDPLPPDIPPDLGRGKPTFKKAVQNVEVVPVKDPEEETEKSEKPRK